MRVEEITRRYRAVREKIGAKNYTIKIGLLSQPNPIYAPTKKIHKNI